MFMQNRLDSLVVKRGCICSGLQAINCRCNRAENRLMNHERGICAGLLMVRTHILDDSERSYVTGMVQEDFNLRAPEKIVKTNSITDHPACRLEEQVYFLHP